MVPALLHTERQRTTPLHPTENTDTNSRGGSTKLNFMAETQIILDQEAALLQTRLNKPGQNRGRTAINQNRTSGYQPDNSKPQPDPRSGATTAVQNRTTFPTVLTVTGLPGYRRSAGNDCSEFGIDATRSARNTTFNSNSAAGNTNPHNTEPGRSKHKEQLVEKLERHRHQQKSVLKGLIPANQSCSATNEKAITQHLAEFAVIAKPSANPESV